MFPGGGSFAITIVPAIVAAILFAAAGAMALLPGDLERRLDRWASGSGRFTHWVARAVAAPALAASGVRTAIELIRGRDAGLLGAPAWWGFDIAVLWAMFHAFGSPPPFTVILMAYFIGTLGNLLPLPGGLGGVEGGMIGAFAAFGVGFNLSCSRCSPTARSRSGCRRFQVWWPTSSCAVRSRTGATNRMGLPRAAPVRQRRRQRARCRARERRHAAQVALLHFTK